MICKCSHEHKACRTQVGHQGLLVTNCYVGTPISNASTQATVPAGKSNLSFRNLNFYLAANTIVLQAPFYLLYEQLAYEQLVPGCGWCNYENTSETSNLNLDYSNKSSKTHSYKMFKRGSEFDEDRVSTSRVSAKTV